MNKLLLTGSHLWKPLSIPQEQHQLEKRLLVAVAKFAGICPWRYGQREAGLPYFMHNFGREPLVTSALRPNHLQGYRDPIDNSARPRKLEYKFLHRFQLKTCCNGLTVMWIKARLALNKEAPNLLQAKPKLNSTYRRRFFRSSIRRPRARWSPQFVIERPDPLDSRWIDMPTRGPPRRRAIFGSYSLPH